MVERSLTIRNATGLHARPAALFVSAAAKYTSKIRLSSGGKEADGKSILGVLGLGIRQGADLTIRADGPDEQQALERLTTLMENGFGEG